MANFNQPCCERCWISQEGLLQGDSLEIRRPVVMVMEHTRVERCSWCGEPTIMGIYKRANPSSVPYPAADDE